ncbi:MAG: hypothetical protein IJN06_01375 [Bacteroidales bacterium]|nr:hypothetical protein [Bacteroidales bacterium]
MKTLLLNALKTKFAGVSDAILDRVATKLAQTVTTAEQVQTAVDGVTFQQVLESYGDSRATQAQQTAVHNYETKYGLKDGVKIETPPAAVPPVGQQTQPTGGGANDTTNQLLQQLLDQNKKLSERLDSMENNRTTETRRQQISTLIAKLPENIQKAYNRTPVENLTEEQFQTLIGEITTEVGDIQSSITQKGAVFGKPAAANGGQNHGTELTKEQEAAISHRGGQVNGETQPF